MSTETLQLVPVDAVPMEPIPLPEDAAVTLGRAPDSTLVLEDPSVSRHHARIERRGDTWTFVDTSGGSGSWIDGVHIAPEEDAEIHDGSSIRIGPRRFLVRSTRPELDAHIVPEVAPAPRERMRADGSEPPASGAADAAGGAAEAGAPRAARAESADRAQDAYATRPSIFLSLRSDKTLDRELGWSEFHRRYAPVVAGFARNAGLRGEEINEVVQDVMFGFFRVSNAFVYDPARGRFRGYLKRVTLNAIRDRWRRRRKEAALPEEMDPASEDPLDQHFEREWAESLLRRALEEVRQHVQPRTMLAFELYGVKGMPAAAVEKETGMTYAAIRHAKMRVLNELQRVVKRLRAEEG
jgi:RNA polymerase sigma-70 factor (ECF subfamily)